MHTHTTSRKHDRPVRMFTRQNATFRPMAKVRARDLDPEQVKRLRTLVGRMFATDWNQTKLAKATGNDRSVFSGLMSGRQGASYALALAVCEAAGVPASTVLGGDDGVAEAADAAAQDPYQHLRRSLVADPKWTAAMIDDLDEQVRRKRSSAEPLDMRMVYRLADLIETTGGATAEERARRDNPTGKAPTVVTDPDEPAPKKRAKRP